MVFNILDKINIAPKIIWHSPKHFFAAGMGSGAMPFAPGTFATLAAIPFYLIIVKFPIWLYVLIVLAAFIVGCWLSSNTDKKFPKVDHASAVWDEWVGLWITLFALPVNFTTIFLGFILFRFFDILKPPPINLIDRYMINGFGVMLDDAVAAIVSCSILHLLYFYQVI